MLCETWQLETVPGKLDPLSAAFKSFSRAEDTSVRLLCKPRSTGERGGGLAFVFKSSLNFSFFNLNINPESFEFMCVKFKGCPPCLFVCFYRRSSVSFVTFRLEFSEFLNALNLVPMPCFILGDFNVKINNLLLSTYLLLVDYSLTNFIVLEWGLVVSNKNPGRLFGFESSSEAGFYRFLHLLQSSSMGLCSMVSAARRTSFSW